MAEKNYFELLDEEGWAETSRSSDGNYVRVEFRASVRSQDWDNFEKFTRSHGYGSGVSHLHGMITSRILQLSTDNNLKTSEVKTALSKYNTQWHEKITRILLTAHMTVIVMGYFVERLLGINSASYIFFQYLFGASLGLAIISYALTIIRRSFLRDENSFRIAAERNFIVNLSKWSSNILFISATSFTLISILRFLVLLLGA